MEKNIPKIVVIIGPTASGKTDLAIKLANKFNGEIVSADSRQIYKKMRVGSGRPLGEWKKIDSEPAYFVGGVAHYLMDEFDPKETVSVAVFKDRALSAIKNISKRGRLPFLVGGTGLYIQTLIDNWEIPTVDAQPQLRQELATESLNQLVEKLKKIDPNSAAQIDLGNRRRVERALEVVMTSGKSFFGERSKGPRLVEPLMIGLNWPKEKLLERIATRLDKQFENGFIEETKTLLAEGYSFDSSSLSSIGYNEIASYLKGELTLNETKLKIYYANWHYAKRQLTWFKKDKRIKLIEGDSLAQAEKLVEDFLRE